MSDDTPARRGYHHGNLKEALLDAARDLVATQGPAGVTLAEASRRAGVSPAAPYRHFKDRDALMAALADRGFAQFGDELAQAFGDGTPDPASAFLRVGDAYLAFARREPGLYGAMFTVCPPGRDTAQGGRAFALLAASAGKAAGVGLLPQGAILSIWALAHGAATLAASGHLDEAEARAALVAGVSGILKGARPG